VAVTPVSTQRPTREAAIVLARERFLAGRRLEAGQIADELGISRTTLYRWFDGRSGLYVETLWSLALDVLRIAEERSTATGLELVYETNRDFWEIVSENPGYRRFVEQDRRIALRIMFLVRGHIRGRFARYVEEMLERAKDELRPDIEIPVLARALTACGESSVFGDDLGSDGPQPGATAKVLRLVIDGARER
jgi:AcrR family transcriptional regulator